MEIAWHTYALIIHQTLYQGCDSVRHTLVLSSICLILTYPTLWNGAGRHGTGWMGDPGLLESNWRQGRISQDRSNGTKNACEGNWIKPWVSNFGKCLYLRYAAVQENGRHPVGCSQPWEGKHDTCTISSSETGDEETKDRIRWKKCGNWDNLVGLESLQGGGEDLEKGSRLHYCLEKQNTRRGIFSWGRPKSPHKFIRTDSIRSDVDSSGAAAPAHVHLTTRNWKVPMKQLPSI